MIPYVAKDFSSVVVGKNLEHVVCEKCRAEFYYELARVGVGKASAAYYIGQSKAQASAAELAQSDLEESLTGDAELVPCPRCGWVNVSLIERYRSQRYRELGKITWLIVILCMLLAGLGPVAIAETFKREPDFRFSIPILLIGFLSPVWLRMIRAVVRKRIDPNKTHPRRGPLPEGTPPALVIETDRQTGKKVLVPMPVKADSVAGLEAWVTLRPDQFVFPAACCVCLATAISFYAPPLSVNENSDLRVPLCQTCRSRLRLRWWIVVLMVGMGMTAVGGVLALLPRGIDEFGRWAMFILVAGFGTLVLGVVIAGAACRPYRVRYSGDNRLIIRFAAKNPHFTALLAQNAAAVRLPLQTDDDADELNDE